MSIDHTRICGLMKALYDTHTINVNTERYIDMFSRRRKNMIRDEMRVEGDIKEVVLGIDLV